MTNRRSRFTNEPVIVIGSGIAGLLLSIELAGSGCKVKLITKGQLDQSNTAWAQGGLAAVTGGNVADTKEQHLADTIAAGDGLTDPVVAERITASGARLVHKLAKHGVAFDPTSLALEGGHRMARVLHTADATGRTIIDGLMIAALKHPNIEIIENCFLKEILTEAKPGSYNATTKDIASNRAYGIVAIVGATNENEAGSAETIKQSGTESLNRSRAETASQTSHVNWRETTRKEHNGNNQSCEVVIKGRAVVLATGGLGQVYARTTNPGTATGDGIAAAYRAGAHLVDMEFVQFHPTALNLEGAPAFLISEAARGAGAVLLDKNGDRFAHLYHSAGELATRDIVSRAIHMCMKEQNTQSVWLDMRRLGEKTLLQHFPTIVAKLRSFGLDPLYEFVPVSPAAHYFMGGIFADECGRTTVQNLYAIGECASNGLHGANRLASNSLLEGGVMALNLADLLAQHPGTDCLTLPLDSTYKSQSLRDNQLVTPIDPSFVPDNFDRETFRNLMLANVGLVRNADSLNAILQSYAKPSPLVIPDRKLDNHSKGHTETKSPAQIESDATYLLGMLIAQSAQLRRESRGAHWRQDCPKADDTHFKSRLLSHRSGFQWISPSRSITQITAASAVGARL